MDLHETICAWAGRYPGCFHVTVDRWRSLGSFPWSGWIGEGLLLDLDVEGVCLSTMSKASECDEPAFLYIWVAFDRDYGFKIHSAGSVCRWAHLHIAFDHQDIEQVLEEAILGFCHQVRIGPEGLQANPFLD